MASSSAAVFKQGIGIINRTRLGFPRHVYQGAGGLGDDLMCTTVFHELRKRGSRRIFFSTQHPSLFEGNPDIDAVIHHANPRVNRWIHEGLPFLRLGYGHHDPITDRDDPPPENVLATLCRIAGLTGPVELRPYLYLTTDELAAARLGENQIVIQSSGLAARYSMINKEWFPERFQEICTGLRDGHTIVQIGADQEPRLEGATDLCGQTSLRQSAAILANSVLFVGLEGLVMHLARAVDCRSVIVYGGRLKPWQIGYIANANITGEPPCSPCWLRSRCDFNHECMRMISPEAVLQAAREQLQKRGLPLETETVVL